MVSIWQFLVIGSHLRHGEAFRKSISRHDTQQFTKFDEVASAGVSSWHMSVGPMDVDEACTYTSLLDAKAELQNGEKLGLPGTDMYRILSRSATVNVAFCNDRRHAVLTSSKLDYSQFAGIQWEDPSLADLPLLAEDTNVIEKYTGSYAFASNVAMSVLNGLLPELPVPWVQLYAAKESWVSFSLPALTQEVLVFDVQLARALNKIPQAFQKLWRGAWEVPASLDLLKLKPQGLARPQFQSTTLSKGHACNFMSNRNEPSHCQGMGFNAGASGCVATESFFPVQYEIQTVHAKDVRKWNAQEEEFILIPEVSFDVISVEKISNDKFWEMSTEQLAQWLRTGFDPAEAPIFASMANVVEAESISGADFVVGMDQGGEYVIKLLDKIMLLEKTDVDLRVQDQGAYGRSVAFNKLKSKMNQVQILAGSRIGRFKLQCASINGNGTMVNNEVPYYYHVVLRDSATQGDTLAASSSAEAQQDLQPEAAEAQ